MAVRHYTDDIGRRGIERLGLITPGADGLVYVTPDSYDSAGEARSLLALSQTPTGYFEIPEARLKDASDPQPVAPAHSMPGGGTEMCVRGAIDVRTPLDGGGLLMKKLFLVCYEYGQGGVWAFVEAASKHDIVRRFPELQVVESRPTWMSETDIARIRERMTLDIDRPSGLLQDLIAQRKGPSAETG